jgi:hypothetical protein
VRERRLRRVHAEQPVRRRPGVCARNLRGVHKRLAVRVTRELQRRRPERRRRVCADDGAVHERLLHVLERSAVRARTTLRCRCLRVHVNKLAAESAQLRQYCDRQPLGAVDPNVATHLGPRCILLVRSRNVLKRIRFERASASLRRLIRISHATLRPHEPRYANYGV